MPCCAGISIYSLMPFSFHRAIFFGCIAVPLISSVSTPARRRVTKKITSMKIIWFSFRFLPESPRWLYGKGRVAEAEKQLLRFARKNGRYDVTEIRLEPPETSYEKKASTIDLVRNFTLFKVTIIQMFSWWVVRVCLMSHLNMRQRRCEFCDVESVVPFTISVVPTDNIANRKYKLLSHTNDSTEFFIEWILTSGLSHWTGSIIQYLTPI